MERLLPAWLLAATATCLAAADWPGYLGPDHNLGAACEAPMVERWADAKLAWLSDVPIPNGMAGDGRDPGRDGEHFVSGGYGSPIVVGDAVYVQYYVPSGEPCAALLAKHGEAYRAKFLLEADDVLHCFDAATGKTRWKKVLEKTSLNLQHFTKGGPSLTPCAADGKVFLHVNGGRVFCLDAAREGAVVWEYRTERHPFQEKIRAHCRETKDQVNYNRDFKTSPTVVAGVVIFNDHRSHKVLMQGGWQYHYEPPSNLVGLDAATGEELWKLSGKASDSAQPVPWTCDGKAYVIANGDDKVVRCFDPRSGEIKWEQPTGDGLTPAVGGGFMICGGAAGKKNRWHVGYRITATGAEEAWELKSHGRSGFSWPAVSGGHAYTESNPRGKLICIELATGTVVAEAPADQEKHFGYFPRVMGSRVVCGGADSELLHLYATGPEGFRRLDDAKIPNAWGYEMPLMPALADGRVYLRTHDHLACIDLRVGAEGTPLAGSPVMPQP